MAVFPSRTIVLEHQPQRDTHLTVTFSREPDDHSDIVPTFTIPRHKWEDMGAPSKLTWHIVPGDMMNRDDGTTARFIMDLVPASPV